MSKFFQNKKSYVQINMYKHHSPEGLNFTKIKYEYLFIFIDFILTIDDDNNNNCDLEI